MRDLFHWLPDSLRKHAWATLSGKKVGQTAAQSLIVQLEKIGQNKIVNAVGQSFYKENFPIVAKGPKWKEGHPVGVIDQNKKKINLVGNLNTAGGGEQSLLTITKELRKAGWETRLFPWGSVHKNYKDWGIPIDDINFKQDNGVTMAEHMFEAPLLFYGKDCVWDFCKTAQPIVEKCTKLIVGINYMLGHFKDPKFSNWIDKSGKMKAVILQNEEKKEDWERQVIGFDGVKKIVIPGAIDIDKFYEVCTAERNKGDKLIILSPTARSPDVSGRSSAQDRTRISNG